MDVFLLGLKLIDFEDPKNARKHVDQSEGNGELWPDAYNLLT
jgi:hypothetical protein